MRLAGKEVGWLNVGNVSARKLAFICITVKSYLHMHVCTWPGRTLQQIAATKALKRDDRCRESWGKPGKPRKVCVGPRQIPK